MNRVLKYLVVLFTVLTVSLFSQNETKKWYFGTNAGLDFMTSPPTILTNGAMNVYEGCASISNSAGSLLFYTDGITVYNNLHATMSNGTGLFGNNTPTQSSIIIKKPGSSTLYYIFTIDGGGGNSSLGFNYSIVDMSLSSGQGSVTVKNASIYSGIVSEKLSAVSHCNGVDVWVVIHEANSPNFRAYLLTSSGLNPTAVVTSIGSNPSTSVLGALKISPNGRKIGVALFGTGSNNCELHDFDASTGILSNSLSLGSGGGAYSCEFSADGTKFYATKASPSTLYQWDLCSGTNSIIVTTQSTIATPTAAVGSLQLAPDGKIYVARASQTNLGVINSPGLAGLSCNYNDLGQSVAPKLCIYGLPNFKTSFLNHHPTPAPFTYTATNFIGCQTAAFTSPSPFGLSPGCFAPTFSLTGISWNFGDPSSGLSNTSTLANPTHTFTSLGTYTVQLIMNYSCGGGSDTLTQTVLINQPCLSVTSTSITCSTLGSATVVCLSGSGPFSYTWMPSAQTGSVASGLGPGTYTITVFDAGSNLTTNGYAVFTSNVPLTGSLSATSSLTCNGVNTGTASITNLFGGSGNPVFLWTNGTSSLNTQYVNGLGAGTWSAVVTDSVSGCVLSNTFQITQPPALTLTIGANTPTACAGTSVSLTGNTTGGTPGYLYNWTSGPASNNMVINNLPAGTYVYTLNSSDTYSCPVSNTVSITFVVNPVLSVSNTSICPLQNGALVVSGANSYTWSNSNTSATLTASPSSNTTYTVIGSALSCTASASGSIFLKTTPAAVASSNSLVCTGLPLNLSASGGTSYAWSGPLGFNSFIQNPVINSSAAGNSGVYIVTVTAANSCTASANTSVAVYQTPLLTAAGSSVCITQAVNLTSSASVPGSSYAWSGPNMFTSTQQNPVINPPSLLSSGYYTVTSLSPAGCTNSAQVNVTVTVLSQFTASNDGPKCEGELINLSGNNNQTSTSFAWFGPNGYNSATQSSTLGGTSPLVSGIYTLTINRGPCTLSKTTSVTIHALPTPTAISNSPVCETKSLILNALTNPTETIVYYSWTGPFAYGHAGSTAPRDSSILSHAGIYTLMVVNSNSCQAITTTSVVINTNPILSVTAATVCLKEPASLNASGANSYAWYSATSLISSQASAYLPSVTSSVTSHFTVTGTAVNGCTASAQTSVVTLPLPTAVANVSPSNKLCLNSTLTLAGSGASFYNWTLPGNSQLTGQTVTIKLTDLSYTGIYTLTAIDSKGCKDRTTLPVNVINLPDGLIKASQTEGCVPFCSTFSFYPSANSASIISQSWELGRAGFSQSPFTLCFNTAGNYLVKGTISDINLCKNTVSYTVNAFPVPVADFTFSPAKPVENTDEVLFYNNSKGDNITNWLWAMTDNSGNLSTHENTSYLFKEAGVHPVALVVKNNEGCSDTIVRSVKVEPDFSVFVPNAFTPNQDANNELFMPVTRGAKSYTLSVFNRWGQKVFESNNGTPGWDGSYKGQACEATTYVWKLSVVPLSGEEKQYSGHVTLYR